MLGSLKRHQVILLPGSGNFWLGSWARRSGASRTDTGRPRGCDLLLWSPQPKTLHSLYCTDALRSRREAEVEQQEHACSLYERMVVD